MRKVIFAALFVLFVSLTAVAVLSQEPAKKADGTSNKASYDELLKKLKGGDTSIDFKALRMSYTETKDYSSYGIDAQERSNMFRLLNEKNYKEAIKAAEKILKTNYVEMNSHMVMAIGHRELGDTKKFDFHKAVYSGLIDSIISGVDGKTPKTAFVVLSVPEEYAILQALEYKRGSQALFTEDGHKFDVLTVTSPKTNETLKLYFNIDIVWKGYEKMFKD